MKDLLSKILEAIKADLNEGVAEINFSQDFLRVEVIHPSEKEDKKLTVAFDADASYNVHYASATEEYCEYCEYYFRGLDKPDFFIGSEELDIKNHVSENDLEDFCESVCKTVNNLIPTVLCYEEPIEGVTYLGCKKILIEPIE